MIHTIIDTFNLFKGVDVMDRLSLILMIIGALNWGLIGLFQYDLVAALFGGQSSLLSRIIYTLVGLAGAYGISFLFRERTANRER